MSRNNDPRPHSHQKTGDGGAIPGIPREVASGTTTVPANGSTTVNLDISRATHLTITGYPSAAFSGGAFTAIANADLDVAVRYNATADGWEVYLSNNLSTDYDVTWTVYEKQ